MTFQELLTLAPDFRAFSDHMPPELDGRFIPRTYPPLGADRHSAEGLLPGDQ